MDKLQAFNCPNCGSPLPVVDVRVLVTCDYCASRVQITQEEKGGSWAKVVEPPVIELISEQYLAGKIEKELPDIFEQMVRAFNHMAFREYREDNLKLIEQVVTAREFHARGQMTPYKLYRGRAEMLIKRQTEQFKKDGMKPLVEKYLEQRDKWLRSISRMRLANTNVELLLERLKGRQGGAVLEAYDIVVEQGGMLGTDFEDNHGVGLVLSVIFRKTLDPDAEFKRLKGEERFKYLATELDAFLKILEPPYCTRYLGHGLENSPYLKSIIVKRCGTLEQAHAEMEKIRKFEYGHRYSGKSYWVQGAKDMLERYVSIKQNSLVTG
jgi:hypothetical protein